jgi:methionyl aminopeptidase
MITTDTKEIETLKAGGKILATVLNRVAKMVAPGVSAFELDKFAEDEIRKLGGKPSFKNYRSQPGDPAFPAALCVSIDNEVVHGIPTKDKILKEGSIVGLDLGVEYQGLFTDMAVTVPVGKVDKKYLKLIDATKEALDNAIAVVRDGATTGDVGYEIEDTAKRHGYEVVRELVGHGVGKAVHEEPEVPCFGQKHKGRKLTAGLVIAIEPMVNVGGWKVNFSDDGWTILTEDGSRSAHFEHTLLVVKDGCEVITKE